MHRLLFEKTGTAVWISHLDTMRTLQRCFRRAGLHIKQTEGYSRHDFVSIALPLPVGSESHCELLDFALEDAIPLQELPAKLNPWMPTGIHVLEALESDRKIRELARLQVQITLHYDNGVPTDAAAQIAALLDRPALMVPKKTKKGEMTEIDLLPMVFSSQMTQRADNISWEVIVSAQNPTLNPELLVKAVQRELPQVAPDAWQICRLEIMDSDNHPFR